MSSETRQVFGIAPSVPYNRHYIFLTVAAEVVDGRLKLLRDAKHEFPTEGNVFVDEPYWAREGVGAIWRVQRTRTAVEGERQAEYSAVGRAQILPLEIVEIAQRSDAPDGVREQLLRGQDLGYTPASSVLIRLGDGPVVGPVRCEPLDGTVALGYRCRLDAFNEPLGFWSEATPLAPVSVLDSKRTAREFTAYLNLPAPQSYFDCAPLDYAVRAMLKTVRDQDGLRHEINKRHIETLARELVAFSPTAKLERRARRVITAFEDHQRSGISVDLLRERLATDPAIQQELTALREKVRADAKAELVGEQKALVASVKELSSRRSQLSGDLEGLTKQIRAAEAQVVATVDTVAERLRRKIAEVANDPAALLSEIALIRPFLTTTPPSSEPPRENRAQAPTDKLHRIESTSVAVSLETQTALVGQIEQNLIAAGLVTGSAKRLGREVLASAKAGQVVIFGGSLANQVARAVALAFAGESSYEYRVPVGLFDDSEVTEAVRHVVALSQSSAAVAALVLEGMNRSAVEAYGEEIRAYVTEQQLQAGAPTGVVLTGTLSRGPSALPVSPAFCELGPIVDTDCLTLGTKAAPPPTSGRVTLSSWGDWRTPTHGGDSSVEVDGLQRAMQGEESVVWRRVVRNAIGQLQSTEATSGSSLIQSISFGWLVPRAHACGVAADQFVRMLKEHALSGENADPRLKRLVERLYPQADTRK